MALYVKNGYDMKKKVYKNISLIILHDFYHEKNHSKIKQKCLKSGSVTKLLKTAILRLCDIIRQKCGMV